MTFKATVYRCQSCGFTFERRSEPETCPQCGHTYILEVRPEELEKETESKNEQ